MDVAYVRNITFIGDVRILFLTVAAVLRREGISSATSATMEEFMGTMLVAESNGEGQTLIEIYS